MDDREAIKKTLQGDSEAFGALVLRHQATVYAVALARVYDREDALDLCQESFLRAYLGLPTLRDHDAFAPWLFTILRRLCVDFVRGKWRKEQSMKHTQESSEEPADLRNEIQASETAESLWTQVGKLDDLSREVLSLHYGHEMKVNEIAALTGVRESAVKMRLKIARARLGERVGHLKGIWGIAPAPAFFAGIMKVVASAGPLKGGMAAASPVLAGGVALSALFLWPASKDLEGWQGRAPAGILRQGKLRIAMQLVFLLVGIFVLPPLVPKLIGPRLMHSSVFLCIYFAVLGVFFMIGFKRQIELLSAGEKLKQVANAVCIFLTFASVFVLRFRPLSDIFLCLGALIALQSFLVNKSLIASAVISPGLWIASALNHRPTSKISFSPTTIKRIRSWLTILHEYGLVAPPCSRGEGSIKVRLRLRVRHHPWEFLAWKFGSSLHADTDGVVSCEVSPRDYIALAKRFGPDELPGRQALGARLSQSFAEALGVYVSGGDKFAIAEALGLAGCPLDVSKSYRYLVYRYLVLLAGVLLVAGSILYRFL